MAKRQTIPHQTVAMLNALAAAIPKRKRPKAGTDGTTRVHCGYELTHGDLERLRAMRTKLERVNFLADVLRHWFDIFAQEIVDHGLVQFHAHTDPADGDYIRVSLGMNLRV